jgi:transcriptional regulator with PAS, ATPase and Fis domain
MDPNQSPASISRCSGEPSYFHLLWDRELDALEPLLDAIASHREEVLGHWHELYLLHFSDKRALSDSEFFQIYGEDLDATVETLREKSIDRFITEISRVGENLAERRVPFAEVIVSMHLFEESATRVFPPSTAAANYRLFDKISHCRTIVLSDTYFRSRTAVAAARIHHLEQEAEQLPQRARSRFHGLVGATPAMRRLYEQIKAAGAVRGTVLVVGESGTGKELVARAIHECSPNTNTPFVALNCAALPRDLIESELFGYKRGAFSGANADHLGLFRSAEGGTLFLDEITEMSPETQSKLLRALQERTVRPVGSTHEIPVNARLIASTNRDPTEAVRSGQLREDLYYRLQVNVLRVPPLRERLDDVALLVDHFIALFNEKLDRAVPVTRIEADALNAMRRHSWPGNVRELSNAVEAAFTFGRSHIIKRADLPPPLSGRITGVSLQPSGPVSSFADTERDLIRRALESTNGNKYQAAKLLGISRKKLYAKIAKYGLSGAASAS